MGTKSTRNLNGHGTSLAIWRYFRACCARWSRSGRSDRPHRLGGWRNRRRRVMFRRGVKPGQWCLFQRAAKGDNGVYRIDPSELHRVSPSTPLETGKPKQNETPVSPQINTHEANKIRELKILLKASQQRLEDRDEQLSDLKEDRDKWRQQATALLEDQEATQVLEEIRSWPNFIQAFCNRGRHGKGKHTGRDHKTHRGSFQTPESPKPCQKNKVTRQMLPFCINTYL